MKYASLSATSKKEYHWNADSEEFREVVQKEWLRWHSENAGGRWFGIVGRNKYNLFLAGKLPTDRVDQLGRNIFTFIALQPENDEDFHRVALFAANMMRGNEEKFFFKWADQLAVAQENGSEIPPFYKNFNLRQTKVTKIGRFQYDCTNIRKRILISESMEALQKRKKDFVVAMVWYSPKRFIENVCGDLAWNAPIALFSPLASGEPIPKRKNIIPILLNYSSQLSIVSGFLILLLCFAFLYMKVQSLNKLNNELKEKIEVLQTESPNND